MIHIESLLNMRKLLCISLDEQSMLTLLSPFFLSEPYTKWVHLKDQQAKVRYRNSINLKS
jgi:hypothetical protein